MFLYIISLQKSVVDITSSFNSTIAGKTPVLVKFYAPWCRHSKELAPIFQQVANECDRKVIFAEVDCTRNNALCVQEHVNGYPTMRLYKDGAFLDKFRGQRTAKEIAEFLANRV